ncbi:hypothetical protein [Nannocystis pusilla]|uniref:hypothetical protein n=1 Tax=Nannocystis pusilla TaxID=889268 RepID=UPI003B767207
MTPETRATARPAPGATLEMHVYGDDFALVRVRDGFMPTIAGSSTSRVAACTCSARRGCARPGFSPDHRPAGGRPECGRGLLRSRRRR